MTTNKIDGEAPTVFLLMASVCMLKRRSKVVAHLFRCRFSALILVEHVGVPEEIGT